MNMSSGDKYTDTSVSDSYTIKIEGLTDDMRREVDERILYILRLNVMTDEAVIEAIIEDESIFELLSNPSDDVIAAYKFQYVL